LVQPKSRPKGRHQNPFQTPTKLTVSKEAEPEPQKKKPRVTQLEEEDEEAPPPPPPPAPLPQDMNEWTVDQAVIWLKSVGLGKLEGIFRKNDVYGKKLVILCGNSSRALRLAESIGLDVFDATELGNEFDSRKK